MREGGDAAWRGLGLAALCGLLGVCDADLVLLDAFGAGAEVEQWAVAGWLAFGIGLGFPVRGRLSLPATHGLVGCFQQGEEVASWCRGAPMAPGSLFTVLPGGTADFALGAGSRITLLLAPGPAFRDHAGRLMEVAGVLPVPPEHALVECHAALARAAEVEAVQALLQEHLHVSSAIAPAVAGRGRLAHYAILRRAEAFMRANLRHNLYLHEICVAADVRERALRYAFDDLLGISPYRYLLMLRLTAAHRRLLVADAARGDTVKAIALACGLWDLSRFSEYYRRVFGETPRQTLMSNAGAASVR